METATPNPLTYNAIQVCSRHMHFERQRKDKYTVSLFKNLIICLNQKEDVAVPLEIHPFFCSILKVMVMMILITSYLLDLYK